MNKVELVTYIATDTELTKAQVESVLNSLGTATRDTLADGGEVTIPEIGKLKVKHQAARTARNPATGETIEVAAKNVVKFSPAKALKESV